MLVKSSIVTSLAIIISIGSFAQRSPFKLDQENPKSVVTALFYAAQTNDFKILKDLCDPLNHGDGETISICTLAHPDDSENRISRKEFIDLFIEGQISGTITYENPNGYHIASVPIQFGPNGNTEEYMKLVEREGKWYLYSF